MKKMLFLLGLLIAFQGPAATLDPLPFPGEKRDEAPQKAFQADWTLVLPPLTETEGKALKTTGTPMQVGIGRSLPKPLDIPESRWKQQDGQWRLRFAIVSPKASGIRLQIAVKVPGSVWRFASPRQDKVYGPIYPQEDTPFWSPVLFGEEGVAEVILPKGTSPQEKPFEVLGISHLYIHPLSLEKDLSDVGASGSCNVDVMCHPEWSLTADAVAKYVYTSAGNSFLCTGTLLNNMREDFRPYFLTANHCISRVGEANSMHSYWFFERTSCGGPIDDFAELTGGASLLNHGEDTDFSILKLREDPPGGAVFAGWSSDPLAPHTFVAGIHHPSGDLE
ncbi:MAG: hypothetical protein D6819_09295, partial [Gammaproteobacteria bacterium]